MTEKQNRGPQHIKRKKPEVRRVVTAAIASLLAVLLLLPMLLTAFGGVRAVSETELRDQISSLQQDTKDYDAKKAELRAQLAQISSDKSKALEQKRILDEELAYIDQQIANTEQEIAHYDELIAQEEVTLAEVQAKEARQFDLFCKRVRAMEEQGTVSYLSILFSAESFSEMLDLFTVISDTIDYDNAVIDQLRADRAAVADSLAKLNAARDEQNAKKAELEERRTEQAEKVAAAAKVLTDVANLESAQKAALAQAEADQKKLEQTIAAKEKELEELIRSKQITFDVGTGYYWPLPGRYGISSLFGNREHPIWHRVDNHLGIDIPAPKNTPIYAARGGVITVSERGASYGNYVVISHGNGDSTLYAHMNSRAVKVGDTVSQGQVIGYVGTTGDSTGYHLHFEVRVNGKRVDPQSKYPSISFYYY